MEKILMHFNQVQYKTDVDRHESLGCQAFQNLIDQFAKMGFGQVLTIQELKELLDDPKGYTLSKMGNEKEYKVLGITLRKEKLFDMMEEPPAGFDVLEEGIKNYHATRRDSISQYRGLLEPDDYEINRGKVALSEKTKKNLKEQHSRYAVTPDQQAIYKAATAIKEQLDKLESQVQGGSKKILQEVLTLDWSEKKTNVEYSKI